MFAVANRTALVHNAKKVSLDLRLLQLHIHRATCGAKEPCQNLMDWLVDPRNLQGAWQRVEQAEGAQTPGTDGLTCAQVKGRVGRWLTELAAALTDGSYRHQAIRTIEVPKPGQPGRVRKIGILTLRDRVVHAALKQILEPILDPLFLPTSFGFRPGRSVAGALDAAVRALGHTRAGQPPLTHAYALDVAECFDSLDHDLLRQRYAAHSGDASVLALLDRLLHAGGATTGMLWWKRVRGVVQGSALSPLVCNLYLHPLDQRLADLASGTGPRVLLLRYADDLLLLAQDARAARSALSAVQDGLGQLRLRLKNTAPTLVEVRQGIDWLGVRLLPRGLALPGRPSFGYVVPAAKVEQMVQRLEDMTQPPHDKIDASAFNLGRWLVSLNTQLRDWRQAYLFADNAGEVFRLLDEQAGERMALLLQRVLGLGRAAVLRQHQVRLPRGFRTWEVNGARLVVLSSLAPQAPEYLTRPPVWMKAPPPGKMSRPVPRSADASAEETGEEDE